MKKSELRKLIREQIRDLVNGKPTPTLTEPFPCATAQYNSSCWCSTQEPIANVAGDGTAAVWEDMSRGWKIAMCEQYWDGELQDSYGNPYSGDYANWDECCVEMAPRSTNIANKNTKRR